MKDEKKIIDILSSGGVVVIPTDTIYEISALAMNRKTVERVYRIKKRRPTKPMIILIFDIADLNLFKIKIDKKTRGILQKIWPGKVSVILPCFSAKFNYLHRGTKSLAFRLPKNKKLVELLKITGPLVATSANPEGFPPAKNTKEAKKYFGEKIDLYVDDGEKESRSSRLIIFKDGKIEILRK
jgi:L-threonylcarbamoyladenylate synthase